MKNHQYTATNANQINAHRRELLLKNNVQVCLQHCLTVNVTAIIFLQWPAWAQHQCLVLGRQQLRKRQHRPQGPGLFKHQTSYRSSDQKVLTMLLYY